MAWLLRGDQVLGSVEVVADRAERRRRLARRDGPEGLVLVPSTRHAHTFGARVRTDVVLCDQDLEVLAVLSGVSPHRLLRPRRGTRCVIHGEAGFAARAGLARGDVLELRE